jgi:hypothetical protein
MSYARRLLKPLFFVAFNLVVGLALLEGILVFFLHSPRAVAAAGGPMQRLIQQTYRHFNRMLIQFDPDCARYDAGVTYTLRPGVCSFGNIEYRNEYHINSAGVRDDEQALQAPEVIVIGDSHAMGWGVDQNQSLVRVMAAKSGLKALDGAVSSYGTVRERMLLDRFDTSRMRVLVIQYTDNDLPENRAFRANNGRLPIMPQADYETIVRYYAAQQRYYPGKYVFRLFMKVLHLEEPEPDMMRMDPIAPDQEAELFLDVVLHAGKAPLDNVKLIVFEINQDFTHPRAFISALDRVARRPEYPRFVRELTTIDSTALVTAKDFYVIDDHMRASGHAIMGAALAAAAAH